MALSAPVSLGNFESGASFGTGAFANSITTVNDSLLVVAVWATLLGTSTANWDADLLVTGGGLTFTQRRNQRAVSGGNIGGLKLFTAPVPAGGGATFNLSVDCGAGNVFHYKVSALYYTGHDGASPVGGLAGGGEGPMSGAVSITLDATPATTSSVLGVLGMFSDNVNIVEGSGWTEFFDFTATAGTFVDMELQTRTGSTSTTVAWTTATSSFGADGHAIGIEIKAGPEGVLDSAGAGAGAFVGTALADGVLASAGAAAVSFDTGLVFDAAGVAAGAFIGSVLRDGVWSSAAAATGVFEGLLLSADSAFESNGTGATSFVGTLVVDGVLASEAVAAVAFVPSIFDAVWVSAGSAAGLFSSTDPLLGIAIVDGTSEALFVGELGFRWASEAGVTNTWTPEGAEI